MTPSPGLPTIRPARPTDVPAVVAMAHELAEYERAPQECTLTGEQLHQALFGPAPALFGHVAVDAREEPVGFALWFLNFSTWSGVHGIHLEDLYVRPAARRTGTGRLLMAALAAICVERGYRRLEWHMLDWNPAAEFYRTLGAESIPQWVPYRLSGTALAALAGQAPTPSRTPAGPQRPRTGRDAGMRLAAHGDARG